MKSSVDKLLNLFGHCSPYQMVMTALKFIKIWNKGIGMKRLWKIYSATQMVVLTVN